jgi:uncharacterized protein YkwD
LKTAIAAAPSGPRGVPPSSYRAIARVTLAALSFTIIIALSHQASTQAGPDPVPVAPEPLLPRSVGIAIETDATISIPFETSMDPASVEAALQVLPAQSVELRWNSERTRVTLVPGEHWRSDERYLVVVPETSKAADGTVLSGTRRYTFTTETAPAVAEFQVHLAPTAETAPEPLTEISMLSTPLASEMQGAAALQEELLPIGDGAAIQDPSQTATAVSASTSISIGFSEVMDRADVESRFAILPEIDGELSWSAHDLVFTPSERLEAGTRYTISLTGAHDADGNVLGGETSISFIVQPGPQLTKTSPDRGADDAQVWAIDMWFSQPMSAEATNEAFRLTDTVTGAAVGGHLDWNEARTKMTFVPDVPFAGNRTYTVTLAKGARDTLGNAFRAEWSFTTGAAAIAAAAPARSTTTSRSAPAIPPPAPATSLAGYALNQVNAARAAYGFAPLVLDASISAVASSHAMDQARNNYFSHYGLDGSSRETRLARGGVSFGWSGENQCYHVGLSQQATLNWCHSQFMAEPYPGQWNHIANILNPNARRMGIGIATVGGKTVITWDFTD